MKVITAPLRSFGHWCACLADKMETSLQRERSQPRAPRPRAKNLDNEQSQRRQIKNLIRALGHRKARVRGEAAQQLGELKIYEALDALAKVTQDSSREVRRKALGALWEMDAELFAQSVMRISRMFPRAEVLTDLDAMVEQTVESSGRFSPELQ